MMVSFVPVLKSTKEAGKLYTFDDQHDENLPSEIWFQESDEGLILFIVFYTQACRWSRCLGCNLPSKMSSRHISYRAIISQIDYIFHLPEILDKKKSISKVILSNNGSILDETTFSSMALMYLLVQLNLNLPHLELLCIETRVEYTDLAELEFISRALAEGDTKTTLEIAIGFEAFDHNIRNTVFNKGLPLELFENFMEKITLYKYRLKCYFMQKPVPGMSDQDAIQDIHNAIDYLNRISVRYNVKINMHLNPTFVATGTQLEQAFLNGEYSPPLLRDVASAVLHAKNSPLSVFIGLYDEGLAVEGGSFTRKEDTETVALLELFNRTQNYAILEKITA